MGGVIGRDDPFGDIDASAVRPTDLDIKRILRPEGTFRRIAGSSQKALLAILLPRRRRGANPNLKRLPTHSTRLAQAGMGAMKDPMASAGSPNSHAWVPFLPSGQYLQYCMIIGHQVTDM
jgi:hypothetical protein